MKIGVMGGTFDPIHVGHLRAAENAREALALDRVLFVPAAVPPHRTEPAASAIDRFAMVALATADHTHFVPSEVELVRQGPSYTVDTVHEVTAAMPGAEVVLIVGSDTFPEIATWHEGRSLLERCRFAVVTRPGAPPATGGAANVEVVDGPALAVSATEVRRRLRERRSVRYLLPPAVADYIAKRKLYAS